MMHEPQSQTIDPNSVLQQVWQNDYPNTWRVFYGRETIVNNIGTRIGNLILITIGLIVACFVTLLIVTGIGTNAGISDTLGGTILLIIIFLYVVLIGVVIFRAIRRIMREHREHKQLRQLPNPTLVVLPDKVVEYRRQMIRLLNFAEIAYMRLRVQANTETITNYRTITNSNGTPTVIPSTSTVPAAPSIWLDLSFYSGRHDAWSLDIPPEDMIAQCILDAYNTYRVKKER